MVKKELAFLAEYVYNKSENKKARELVVQAERKV